MHHLGVLLLVGLAFRIDAQTSECASGSVADVCASHAQTCVDPEPWTELNNWQCHCDPADPATGVGELMPALCPADGPDCQQNDCPANQLCVSGDPNNDGEYQCHCKDPAKGVYESDCVGEEYLPDVAMNPFGYIDCADFMFETTLGTTCDCNTEINGASVIIEGPTYDTDDTLACPNCATGSCDFGNCDFQIVPSSAANLVLEMNGAASIAEYAKALKSLVFKTASWEGAHRRISYTFGDVHSVDDHFYKFFPQADYEPYWVDGATFWEAAQAFCADTQRDVFGMPGYMVTLTSQIEQDHVFASVATSNYGVWVGLSDIGEEGVFRWITGPEGCDRTELQLTTLVGPSRTGCNIFPIQGGKKTSNTCGDTNNVECTGGTVVYRKDGHICEGFCEFRPGGEPSNSNGVEEFVHMFTQQSGYWNDVNGGDDDSLPSGNGHYDLMCEWGGFGKPCFQDVFGSVCLAMGHPASGVPGTNGPASCVLDECTTVCATCAQKEQGDQNVCEAEDQTCYDINVSPDHLGTWSCTCVLFGSATNSLGPAPCALDECNEDCGSCAQENGSANVCEEAGQTCVENSNVVFEDWQCKCKPPRSGSLMTIGVADCVLDECEIEVNTNDVMIKVNKELCAAALGQVCMDDDKVNDENWVCQCLPGFIGEPMETSVTTCMLDECSTHTEVCSTQGQACVDDSTLAADVGDWYCECIPPDQGERQKNGAAACVVAGGDCQENGQICHDHGQSCLSLQDPYTESPMARFVRIAGTGSYLHVCEVEVFVGGVNVAIGKMATQQNDYHSSYAELAIDGDTNTVFTGGSCQHTLSQGSWWELDLGEEMRVDEVKVYNRAEVSSRIVGYNLVLLSAAGVVLDSDELSAAAGEQVYFYDFHRDPSADGHFECHCIAPAVEYSLASCTAGVFEYYTNVVVNPMGHLDCDLFIFNSDPDCNCDFEIESAFVKIESPTYEVGMDQITCPACGDAGIAVLIEDTETAGISRVLTMTGRASIEDYTKALKSVEFITTSHAGESRRIDYNFEWVGNSCFTEAFGAVCLSSPTSLEGPTGVPGKNSPATCVLDECTSACSTCAKQNINDLDVCTAAGQTCEDKDTRPTHTHDWKCYCVLPFEGEEDTAAAGCVLDECKHTQSECETCAIPVTATNDPEVDVCAKVGQQCVEVQHTVLSDWQCHCIEPQKGPIEPATPTTCTLDECLLYEQICIMHDQVCVDLGLAPDATGDWKCQCRAPSDTTQAEGFVETCIIDECDHLVLTHYEVCEDARQFCRDDDHSVSGDWQCHCIAPMTGSDIAGRVLHCDIDECTTKCGTCANTGIPDVHVCTGDDLECVDSIKTDEGLSDWVCTCKNGGGTKIGGAPAVCAYDECEPNNVCTDEEQECVDSDHTITGNWFCKCILPRTGEDGSPGNGPTDCILDECTLHGSLCSVSKPEWAPQVCKDDNTAIDRLDDWACHCELPAIESTSIGLADCLVDECMFERSEHCDTCAGKGAGNTCVAKGQTCSDPDLGEGNSQRGDWVCSCVFPEVGSEKAAPADCMLDECIETEGCKLSSDVSCNVCEREDPAQECNDPNPTPASKGDWTCACPFPSVSMANASVAICQYDECIEQPCPKTDPLNRADWTQLCFDDDHTTNGTWHCECQGLYHGTKDNAPAVCTRDECGEHGTVCTGAGQECRDDDLEADNTWTCYCIHPDVEIASGTQAAATCELSLECNIMANHKTCEDAGQRCHDPSETLGDWVCTCPPLYETTISATIAQRVAECVLDECATACPSCEVLVYEEERFCETHGQKCNDMKQDWPNEGDWRCECVMPATGDPSASPRKEAFCKLNECEHRNGTGCDTCAGTTVQNNICTDAGQECNDPNDDQTSSRDWVCVCLMPSKSTAPMLAVNICIYDECTDSHATCTSEDQDCVDPIPELQSQHDWRCLCRLPHWGSMEEDAAACELNECIADVESCSWCAGTKCSAAGQTCVDPSLTTDEDWYCQCANPQNGTKEMNAVPENECVIDECTTTCDHCAKTGPGTGNVCELGSQICNDPDTSVASSSDWTCTCSPPFASIVGKQMAAICSVDECVDTFNGSLAGMICTNKDQECDDPSFSTLGDFVCTCKKPRVGDDIANAANCMLNECLLSENNETCTNAGQDCDDVNFDFEGTWYCHCPKPSLSSEKAAKADCLKDECLVHGGTCMAATPPQDCKDLDLGADDTWICLCRLPAVGNQSKRAADCTLDECEADCRTCEDGACSLEEQGCEDDKLAGSTGNWVCQCYPPKMGEAIQGPAKCTVNECFTRGDTVCDLQSQDCHDRDEAVLANWYCECRMPLRGSQDLGAAPCELDECDEHEQVCTALGQTCEDPFKLSDSTGNWLCRCPPPATETMVIGGATCTFLGDCAVSSVRSQCESAGQQCADADQVENGVWHCKCVSPAKGLTKLTSRAVCLLDECVVQGCRTCAGATCSSASQECVDDDQDVITGRNSWACHCRTPEKGLAVADKATCAVDECIINGLTCQVAEQLCEDPDPSSSNDWQCKCHPPATDVATRKPALCTFTLDECTIHSVQATCVSAGQTCVDPGLAKGSKDDWECHCDEPRSGSAQGGVAACTCVGEGCGNDECEGNGMVCEKVMQACVDPNPSPQSTGDWECRCTPQHGDGTGHMEAAQCEIDECSAACESCEAGTCEEQGQTCSDRSLGTLGDWWCGCPPEFGGATQVGGPAVCVQSECAVDGNIEECKQAGQTCVDPNETIVGDWGCQCDAPRTGFAKNGKAMCRLHLVDECADTDIAAVCEIAKQSCVDKDQIVADNWECRCVSPGVGTAVGRAVEVCKSQASAVDDNDKDDSCWWCWLLLVLGVCCCCCFILVLFFAWKRRQQDVSKDAWEHDVVGRADDDDFEMADEDREQYKKSYKAESGSDSVDQTQTAASLLYGENEAENNTTTSTLK